MSKRAFIFSGGNLGDWALENITPQDELIGADRGAMFLIEHGFTPDLAIGDFDSVAAEQLETIRRQSRRFIDCDPVWKDLTDTEMALQTAMELFPDADEIRIVGALGSRFDHSLANVHLLRRALDKNFSCAILDACNEIRLIDSSHPLTVQKGRFPYLSLLPLSLQVTGVTLTGFQYPLDDALLEVGHSLGISNVIEQDQARIEVGSGLLLVIQSRDVQPGR